MRKLNELIIRGGPAEMAKLVEKIESSPENGWSRNRAVEEKFRLPSKARPTGVTPSTYCFTTPHSLDYPASHVLFWKTYGMASVSNVLPIEHVRLTDDQYNRILDHFKDEFLESVVAGLDVEVRIDPFRVKMEEIVSPMALEKLDLFSKSSDKATICSEDRRNWSSFVTQVHMDDSSLDADELNWWLGHSGWPEEQRRQLLEAYGEGLSMLKEYDEARFERTR